MDDGKQAEPRRIPTPEEPSSISEGVSILVGSVTTLVTDAASVVVDVCQKPR